MDGKGHGGFDVAVAKIAVVGVDQLVVVSGLVERRIAGDDHRQVLFAVAVEVAKHGLELGDQLEARTKLALDGKADALGDFGCGGRRGSLRKQRSGGGRKQRAEKSKKHGDAVHSDTLLIRPAIGNRDLHRGGHLPSEIGNLK